MTLSESLVPTLKKINVKVEEFVEDWGSPLKPYIPSAARFLIVATFVEDGLRIFFQWPNQVMFLKRFRGFSSFVAMVFLVVNMVLQLVCSTLVLIRKYVSFAVIGLFSVLVLQTVGYGMLFEDFSFVCRVLSVTGGLLLLIVETMPKEKNIFAGLPMVSENRWGAYIQLLGRILLVFLFFSVAWGKMTILRLILSIFGLLVCIMVAVGFKAKWSAAFFVTVLSISNIIVNSWWSLSVDHPLRDFHKYDFFQNLSIMGGFLLLVGLGPGGVSVDEKKKKY
jgi:ER-derived vesicles protein